METLPHHVQQRLQTLYTDLFPIEVRYVMSEWFEHNSWDDIDPDNPQHEDHLINHLMPEMFAELKRKTASSGMDIKFRLTLHLQKMETAYNQNGWHLIRFIKQCLTEEANIVNEFENVSPNPHNPFD